MCAVSMAGVSFGSVSSHPSPALSQCVLVSLRLCVLCRIISVVLTLCRLKDKCPFPLMPLDDALQRPRPMLSRAIQSNRAQSECGRGSDGRPNARRFHSVIFVYEHHFITRQAAIGRMKPLLLLFLLHLLLLLLLLLRLLLSNVSTSADALRVCARRSDTKRRCNPFSTIDINYSVPHSHSPCRCCRFRFARVLRNVRNSLIECLRAN